MANDRLYISQVKMPDNQVFYIKDEEARDMINKRLTFVIAEDAATTPAGVTWKKDGQTITGTLAASAANKNAIYMVPDATSTGKSIYAEYVVLNIGTEELPDLIWEKIGDTDIQIDAVTLNKGSGDNVLGEGTTFTNADSAVTFSGTSSDEFIKGYAGSTSKLVTGTVTGVSGSTTASKATAGTAVDVAKVGTAVVYGTADVADSSTEVVSGLSGTTTFNTDAIKAAELTGTTTFVTEAIKAAELTGTTTFNTDAIKAAELTGTTTFVTEAIKAAELTGTTTFNTDAIKAASLTGTTTFNTDAIKAAELTGETTFVTEAIKAAELTGTTTFTIAGITASVDSSNECLTFVTASTGTVGISTTDSSTASVGISTTAASTGTVGISTTDSSTGTVGISTTAASTGTVSVTTVGIYEAVAAPSTQTLTPATSNGTITPYTFADVTVPIADNAASTFATGALDADGSGDEVMIGLGTATTATAITGLGTATAAAQTITVSSDDLVKVALYDDLSVTTL